MRADMSMPLGRLMLQAGLATAHAGRTELRCPASCRATAGLISLWIAELTAELLLISLSIAELIAELLLG
jgi:hypothetical protein